MGTDNKDQGKMRRTNVDATLASALKMSLHAFVAGARNSGRTCCTLKLALNHIVTTAKGRSVYIAPTEETKRRAMYIWGDLCAEQGLSVKQLESRVQFVSIRPGYHHLIEAFQGYVKFPAQVFFDHTWIEQYHENMIEQAQSDLVGLVLSFDQRYEVDEPPVLLDTSYSPGRGPQS